MYLVAIFVTAAVALTGAQHPSPCPAVFQYTNTGSTEPGQWSGEIVLDTEFPLAGVWIKFLLDRKVDQVKSAFGTVVVREEKAHLIKSREYNLVPGAPLHIPVSVHFPAGETAASVVGIRLNGRTVCPAAERGPVTTKCPGVFTYNKDKEEENRWHGTVTLSSEFELKGVWARLVLDQPAELLGNEFGEVRTTDNLSYLISNRNHTLVPGRPLRLAFWVKYAPGAPVPAIHTVRLNGRTICGEIIAEDNNQ